MAGSIRVEGLVEYTRGQLECMAADLLRRRVDVPFRVPINVELLLEGLPDVHIEECHGLLNKHSVEGAVCNELLSRELTVLVDYNIMNGPDDGRYNAVIGEELAHIVLHRSQIHQVRSLDDFLELRRCPQWRRIEQDARTFSGAVLMPTDLINESAAKVYEEAVDDLGYGDPHGLYKTLRNRLAQSFVVPVDDMHSRLLEWPCQISARVIASVEDGDSRLKLALGQTTTARVQRRLIEEDELWS